MKKIRTILKTLTEKPDKIENNIPIKISHYYSMNTESKPKTIGKSLVF